MIDAYAIARSLINDLGDKALEEVQANIERYTETQNYNALKSWYEVEDALQEMTKHKAAVS